MEDALSYLIPMGILFIGLPWIILHYITRWKTAATLTSADENLMEDLYDVARRLEERLGTVERILTAENPNWRALASDPMAERLEAPMPRAADESEFFSARTVSNEPGRISR